MGESDGGDTVEGQGELRATVCWSCSYISAQTCVRPGRNATCGEDPLAPAHNLNHVTERAADVHEAAANGGDESLTSAGARFRFQDEKKGKEEKKHQIVSIYL